MTSCNDRVCGHPCPKFAPFLSATMLTGIGRSGLFRKSDVQLTCLIETVNCGNYVFVVVFFNDDTDLSEPFAHLAVCRPRMRTEAMSEG